MVKQWDVREISLDTGVAAGTINDLISFEYTNDREATHIETVRNVVGYNLKYPKPTWNMKIRITSNSIAALITARNQDKLFVITFTAPGTKVVCYDSIINKINFGTMATDATEVTVDGLALKITEDSAAEKGWKDYSEGW